MPMSKITRNRQVTIPKDVFDQLELKQGDYLEFVTEGGVMIVQPKTLQDRNDAKQQLFELVEQLHEQNKELDADLLAAELASAINRVRDKTPRQSADNS